MLRLGFGQIFSPLSSEQTPIGKQIHIRSDAAPDFIVRLFHIHPLEGITKGDRVTAGEQLGLIHADQGTDIAIEVNSLAWTQNFSYFAALPDHLFAAYQARGVNNRNDLIISKAERDANPLACNGEQFRENYDRAPLSDHYVYLSGYEASERFNPYQESDQNEVSASPLISTPTASTSSSDIAPPLLLKSLGLELGVYDPVTNRAGDFLFTKKNLQFDRLWMDYGFVIPGDQTSTGENKANPQPTFIVPLGTKVRALVDGEVLEVKTLYSGDWTVMIGTGGNSPWRYETEHVVNPLVKVGDRVTAGQVVAEAANFNNNAPEGFGLFEIGILKGGNPPDHICPFAYLDPLVKEQIQTNIRDFYQAWEDYTGDTSLYDEAAQPLPGCATLQAIEG